MNFLWQLFQSVIKQIRVPQLDHPPVQTQVPDKPKPEPSVTAEDKALEEEIEQFYKEYQSMMAEIVSSPQYQSAVETITEKIKQEIQPDSAPTPPNHIAMSTDEVKEWLRPRVESGEWWIIITDDCAYSFEWAKGLCSRFYMKNGVSDMFIHGKVDTLRLTFAHKSKMSAEQLLYTMSPPFEMTADDLDRASGFIGVHHQAALPAANSLMDLVKEIKDEKKAREPD